MDKLQLRYNQAAQQTLAAYIAGGRLPHAILLEGPTGCGKYTFARTVACGILCQGEAAPCGQCAHCRKIHKGIHPDVITYQGEGNTRWSFHVDLVREIRKEAHVRPNEARAKVLILRDIQAMTIQAQNALLKMIEEPPAGVHFVCTCENKAALLSTILSRVAVISLAVPDVEQCLEALEELAADAAPERRRSAAVQSGGNIGRALALLEEQEETSLYETAAVLLYNAAVGNELEALVALQAFEWDRAKLRELLELLRSIAAQVVLDKPSDIPEIRKLSARLTPLQAVGIVDIIDEIADAVEQNVGGLLLTTALCGKIRRLLTEPRHSN